VDLSFAIRAMVVLFFLIYHVLISLLLTLLCLWNSCCRVISFNDFQQTCKRISDISKIPLSGSFGLLAWFCLLLCYDFVHYYFTLCHVVIGSALLLTLLCLWNSCCRVIIVQ
jgi:hypothetical protein